MTELDNSRGSKGKSGRRGRFITVEGVEGVGKSTSIEFIAQLLARHGFAVTCTREPGGTPIAEAIRDLLLDRRNQSMDSVTELLLVFAARAQHVHELIEPALDRGDWVICDRFTDSTYAYQGAGRGIDAATIARLEEIALGDFRPDLTLILDMGVEEGMRRALSRGERDRFETEDVDFFERVRGAFIARARGNPRYHLIDASGDVDSVRTLIEPVVMGEIARAGAGG